MIRENDMKVTILGAGLVGGPMARDLAKDGDFEVTIADISSENLSRLDDVPAIGKVRADLSDDEKVKKLTAAADYVINATPGFMGHSVLRSVIEAGVDVVDIAFFPEDPFTLDTLARERGVTAIVDCGVAPGMSNVLVSHAAGMLDEALRVLIYVGGLPIRRTWPWEYKAGFSPIDVLEEYTRPARYVENGRLVTRPALSDPEYLDFPGIGTLESFNSDGLRTLAETMDINDMKEKTLRYPGHIEKIAVLRESGFFSTEEIEIGGTKIRPLDFTARLLFPLWELAEEFREYARRGGQVFVSTHSPDFLNATKLEEVFWLVKKDGFSEVRRASQDEQIRAYMSAGDQMGYLWKQGFFEGSAPR